MPSILSIAGLTKDFDGFRAVDSVDLDVSQGEIHSVIGPNGAGKSTLFYMVTGHIPPSRGEVRLSGHAIGGCRPHQIARRGLACSFQVTSVFPGLTVEENIYCALLARDRLSMRPAGRTRRRVAYRAKALLSELGLLDYAERPASALSHGDQRALEMGLALAGQPRVLLLDEPTAGMSTAETARMTQQIMTLARNKRLAVLLVEHDMSVVFTISDTVTVMHRGAVLARGTPDAVRNDSLVTDVYLGRNQESC